MTMRSAANAIAVGGSYVLPAKSAPLMTTNMITARIVATDRPVRTAYEIRITIARAPAPFFLPLPKNGIRRSRRYKPSPNRDM